MQDRSSIAHGIVLFAALAAAIVAIGSGSVLAALVALTSFKYFIALAGLLALGLGLAASGNPRLALLYLMLFLLPIALGKQFAVLAHQGGADSFEIAAYEIPMYALLAFQVRDWAQGYLRPYRFPHTTLVWLALTLLGIYSILTADVPLMAAHEFYRMLKMFILMIVLVNEVVRRRLFIHAVIALLAGVGLEAAIAIGQYLKGGQFGLSFLGEATEKQVEITNSITLEGNSNVYRPGGLLGHTNLLSAFLVLQIPLAIALLFAPVRAMLKFACMAVIVATSIAVILTLSRAGWAMLGMDVVGVVFLTYAHPRARTRYFLVRIAIVILIGVILVVFSGKILRRLDYARPAGDEARIVWLERAGRMVLANPVLGVGLNNYTISQPRYMTHGGYRFMLKRWGGLDHWPAVHSSWMLTWAEQGTVGLLLLAAFSIGVCAVGLRNLRIRDPILHAIGVGLLCGFAAIMVIDSWVSFFIRERSGIMYWCVAGLILALGCWRDANEVRGGAAPARASPANARAQGNIAPA